MTLATRSVNERDPLDDMRRAQVLEAVAEIVAERGLRGASVAAVSKRASVSAAALGELFGDLDRCFLALLDSTLARATASIEVALERDAPWREGVLTGLEGLLTFLDSEPVSARACLLEGAGGSALRLESRTGALERLVALIGGVRAELSFERQPPAAMPEATIAAVLGILRMRLLAGQAPPYVALLDELAEVIVAPYLGPAAAAGVAHAGGRRRKEILRDCPAAPADRDVEIPQMLRHGSARRMRSCLRFLAEHPGANNQDVARGLAIAHAGQVSVLLSRLHKEGLLAKKPGRPGRPNAWSLSPRGAGVARALQGR